MRATVERDIAGKAGLLLPGSAFRVTSRCLSISDTSYSGGHLWLLGETK